MIFLGKSFRTRVVKIVQKFRTYCFFFLIANDRFFNFTRFSISEVFKLIKKTVFVKVTTGALMR